jgi:hypothetical protein
MMLLYISLLIATLLAVSDASIGNSSLPLTVEFDLIFPRNETYSPEFLLPVVFAIRNPQAAMPFHFAVFWSITSLDKPDLKIDGSETILGWANYPTDSGAAPFYVPDYAIKLNDTEGHFALSWWLEYQHCSARVDHPDGVSLGPKIDLDMLTGRAIFTLKKEAQKPSLLTGPDSCPIEVGTFNLTGVLDVPYPEVNQRNICAITSAPAQRPQPCAIQIDNVTASSISASITSLACHQSMVNSSLIGGCQSLATRLGLGSTAWVGLTAGLVSGIMFMMLI